MRLKLETLYQSVWQLFGFQHTEAIADRDDYRAKMEKRLGSGVALDIQRHVDAAMKRIQIDAVDPTVMTRREFYELLALEQSVREIAHQIDATAAIDGLGSEPSP